MEAALPTVFLVCSFMVYSYPAAKPGMRHFVIIFFSKCSFAAAETVLAGQGKRIFPASEELGVNIQSKPLSLKVNDESCINRVSGGQ